MKTYHYILILTAFAAGFFLGRSILQTNEKVRYVKGETVSGSISSDLFKPVEFRADIKQLPLMFWKYDTVRVSEKEYVMLYPDTAAAFNEFMKRKEYEFTTFNDENGEYIAKPVVQFNNLVKYDYAFTPRYKEVTKFEKKLFTPFVSASYSTFDLIGAGGGMFINNFGIEYQYQYNYLTGETGHMVGGKIKF